MSVGSSSGSSGSGSSNDSSSQQQQEQTGLSAWTTSPLESFSESAGDELGSAEATNEGLSLVADLEEGEQMLTLDL